SIEMNDYTNKLVQHLANAFGIDNSKIDFKTNSGIIKLDIDTAIPIALILNELIINALKYAYIESKKLQLILYITEENKTLKLFFSDNGTEANAEKIANSKSFGSKLIQLLTKQLNGEMEVKANNGVNYTFIFKEYKIIN
ncbi:MAG: sensor histidine kinase, partial [Bacteroidia bacterium]|nr:sensor histidine kinase [Bacteroidia bacterium]